MTSEQEISGPTGVWLCGALGGLATTVIVGAVATAKGLVPPRGIATLGNEFNELSLIDLGLLRFGGNDVRSGSLVESAFEIAKQTSSISPDLIRAIEPELREIDREIRPGSVLNSGDAIDAMVDPSRSHDGGLTLEDRIAAIQTDLRVFQERHQLARIIVVNVTSTEPRLDHQPSHDSLEALRSAIKANDASSFRSSLLYAYAAIDLGHAFVNFTPSKAFPPAICELAATRGVPFMGSDGKTGETLVKSALAPMFRHRALQVLTWQGYNILGDRDGQVLSNRDNLSSKVASKDHLVSEILGYPLHTHVAIDYVPSLHDLKTAWDFIHFEGFLGHRMSMQFIWQGCDAILAAPLILDLVRLTEYAVRNRESGAMEHLACFFKSPHDVEEHDLHRQWELLMDYVNAAAAQRGDSEDERRS